ncbi:MAG TPA: hypothetical protein PLJ62_04620 [Thermoflexales bacterium]|nr:hypothetical protein [Thermoflexales bacterium]HQW35774.1 hypothetical protein [Thermoflexales bacterium]HQZ99461.1 hypothetical protein [Thermoflexales bacterium]
MLFAICTICAIGGLSAPSLLKPRPPNPYTPEKRAVLSKIAAKYGVPEDWPSARFAIYCIVFRSGRQISDVEADITQLGKWEKGGSDSGGQYYLEDISVEEEIFKILFSSNFGRITRIYVLERSDQSDAQPIVCFDDTYLYSSSLHSSSESP